MSSNQDTLETGAAEANQSDYVPLRLRRERGTADTRSLMEPYGIDPANIGTDPRNLSESKKERLWRYQYDKVFIYPRRVGPNTTEYEPIEFRTYIVTVGPPSEELKDFIDGQANERLRTLFNTGPYQGYMSGFRFVEEQPGNREDDAIAVTDANNVGVPQFEVLVKKSGRVQGQATGFFYPFDETVTDRTPDDGIPQQETWNISRNDDRYRIEPPAYTGARQRAENIRGKRVYVNGEYIGDMASGGRVWLKKEYQSADQTYRGQHSRKYLVQNTGATYSAIRDGGNLYKVSETDGSVYLVTASEKPDDFDSADPDTVDEGAVGRVVSVEFAAETTFDIRTDSGPMMGRYDTPMTRSIGDGTRFLIYA